MVFKPHVCITVECDGGCRGGGYEEEGPYHFADRDAAIAWCRTNDWVITDAQQLCPDCARKADCQATGHQWDDHWLDHEHRGVTWRTRLCDHCCVDDYDPPQEQVWVQLSAADIVQTADGREAS